MAYHIFRIPVGYRLYDREKNKVVLLHQNEYQALDRIQRGEEIDGDIDVLQKMQKRGFCCESTLEKIEHMATDTVESSLKTKMQHLILQVTQNCNLRCTYCAYSGKYFNRQHNGRRMSLHTALSAIDFFMNHSSDVDEVVIGFYGGEPILEFDLIKKVIEYVETSYCERKVRFNFTTNLTLFTDEVINYVVEKNIEVMISLDGPRSIQDKYRVFADGRGSYNQVVANARRLREKSPKHFGKFATNTVASPGEDYESIRSFLDTDELFGPLHSMFTQVNDSGLKEQVYYSDDYYRMLKREKFKIFLYMLGEVTSDKVSRLLISEKAAILLTFKELIGSGTVGMKRAHPGGPCIPGVRRLFVDTEGNFYPCERITELKQFQIGNLTTGFDLGRIKEMLNVGQFTEDKCLDCWAFMSCGTCIANMVEGEKPTRNMRLQRCSFTKRGVEGRLADLETLKYYGCNFSEEGED